MGLTTVGSLPSSTRMRASSVPRGKRVCVSRKSVHSLAEVNDRFGVVYALLHLQIFRRAFVLEARTVSSFDSFRFTLSIDSSWLRCRCRRCGV